MEKITFETLPAAVQQIQADISEIKRLLTPEQSKKETSTLLTLPQAAQFLSLSKPTIYRLVSGRSICFHKQGSRLYFIESELVEWVKSGRKTLR